MITDSVTLLKQLGSRTNAPSSVQASGQSIESTGFAELLAQARSGGLGSATPVTIAPDAKVSLTPDELARLSVAADRAEAAGIRTALVMIGDQKLVLDVSTRQITGKAPAASGAGGAAGVYPGVDGVIDLLASPAGTVSSLGAAGAGRMGLAGAGIAGHPGVLKAIAGADLAA